MHSTPLISSLKEMQFTQK